MPKQVWKLSSTDLCEVARNGVLHSGFPHACKKHWVAAEYWRAGPDGNDIHKTNVPNLRMRFR
jgi:AMP deaminase